MEPATRSHMPTRADRAATAANARSQPGVERKASRGAAPPAHAPPHCQLPAAFHCARASLDLPKPAADCSACLQLYWPDDGSWYGVTINSVNVKKRSAMCVPSSPVLAHTTCTPCPSLPRPTQRRALHILRWRCADATAAEASVFCAGHARLTWPLAVQDSIRHRGDRGAGPGRDHPGRADVHAGLTRSRAARAECARAGWRAAAFFVCTAARPGPRRG